VFRAARAILISAAAILTLDGHGSSPTMPDSSPPQCRTDIAVTPSSVAGAGFSLSYEPREMEISDVKRAGILITIEAPEEMEQLLRGGAIYQITEGSKGVPPLQWRDFSGHNPASLFVREQDLRHVCIAIPYFVPGSECFKVYWISFDESEMEFDENAHPIDSSLFGTCGPVS
jgi:hypothetical protein